MIVVTVSTMAKDANAYTRASTEITNKGTLSFSVGGQSQNDQNSSEDVFKVDRKVDLVVAHSDGSYVIVNPNNTNKILTFTVRNDGNDVQDYNLTFLKGEGDPWGGSHTKDMDNVRIIVDENNDSIFNDTATFIDELKPDENMTVYIVVDVPGDAVSTDIGQYTLIAETRTGGDTGNKGLVLTKQNDAADDPATVQNVFADADGVGTGDGSQDAKHADWDAFKVEAAIISFQKWSIVIKDPVNSTGAGRKRIPGAVIRYCFDINNSGDKNATDVSWTDDLNETATKHDALDYNDSMTWHQSTQGTCDCTKNSGGYAGGSIDASGVVTMVMEDEHTLTSPIEVNQQACGWIEATIK